MAQMTLFVVLFALLLPVAPGALPMARAAASVPPPAQEETLTPDQLATATAPRTLGSPDAPVTLVEYSSLSCSHCAQFHAEVFPQIKAAYIDTGKVRFVFRHLPTSAPAMGAAMGALCAAPNDEGATTQGTGPDYFALLDALFASQRDWAFTRAWRDKMKAHIPLTPAALEACLASPGLKAFVVGEVEKAGQDYAIDATPSFVVNGESVIRGAQDYATFAGALDAALRAAP